jgi:succinyl-diaminopimelate desuccinylase
MVALVQELVRIPTVNPPGDNYEACARLLGERYRAMGYRVEYVLAEDHPDHSARYPRMNVLARLEGASARPCVHFNGHIDVVPAGNGWTVDPFGGVVRDGKVYGRGTSDMKAGMVASLFAVEALRREGIRLGGAVEQSGTVDEESGGFAGALYLSERGYFAKDKQDHVIITEPLDPDRVCLGHRGVYWFDVITRGHQAHGSMPFLGENAIDRMSDVIQAFASQLRPKLATRVTELPVVPEGARHATLNLNSIAGGQSPEDNQSPCVPDRCTAIFDRRFLPEEKLEDVRAEIDDVLKATGLSYELRDRMIVHPTSTRRDAPLVRGVGDAIEAVYGRAAQIVASPGTYDQKHVTRAGGIEQAIAYGPGRLTLAHQPDEHVAIADLENAAKVMALATMTLLGAAALVVSNSVRARARTTGKLHSLRQLPRKPRATSERRRSCHARFEAV